MYNYIPAMFELHLPHGCGSPKSEIFHIQGHKAKAKGHGTTQLHNSRNILAKFDLHSYHDCGDLARTTFSSSKEEIVHVLSPRVKVKVTPRTNVDIAQLYPKKNIRAKFELTVLEIWPGQVLAAATRQHCQTTS